jgi:ABC-type multidrug transport system ATPase subunit
MVCDRVAMMVQGTVISQGTIGELTTYGRHYVIEALPAPGTPQPIGELILPALAPTIRLDADHGLPNPAWEPASPQAPVRKATLPDGTALEIDQGIIRVGTDEPAAIQPLLDALRTAGLMIRSTRPVRPSLEDLFMKAVQDPATGRAIPPGAASGAVKAGARP